MDIVEYFPQLAEKANEYLGRLIRLYQIEQVLKWGTLITEYGMAGRGGKTLVNFRISIDFWATYIIIQLWATKVR